MSANDLDLDLDKLSAWDSEQFGYPSEYQKFILAAILHDKDLYYRIGTHLKAGYFDNAHVGRVFKNLSEFIDTYKDYPSETTLTEYTASHNGGVISDTTKEVIYDIYHYGNISAADIQHAGDLLTDFVRNQEAKRVIISNMDTISNPNGIDKLMQDLDDVRVIAADINDLGVDVYSDEAIEERIRKRQDTVNLPRIPFKWTYMDEIFGGLGKRELFSIIGASGGGKSMFLVNIGANVLFQRKNVLYISLELSEEKIMQRFDMSMCGCTKNELNNDNVIRQIRERQNGRVGKLIVKSYPSDITKPSEIEKLMRKLESVKKFVPDLLIIDYADILASPVRFNEKRHELGTIYRYIRNIGVTFDIPVLTATQANRGAVTKIQQGKLLDEADIAEAYDIFRVLDAAVTINASGEDMRSSNSVLYVVKNRDGFIGQRVIFETDWSKAYAREKARQ